MAAAMIWARVLMVTEYLLLGLTYLAKNRKLIVLLDIASMSLGIVVYLLEGADLGMGMSIIILLANFYYLWDEWKYGERTGRKGNKYETRDVFMLAAVMFAIGAIAVMTYDGPLSLLSVAATVLYEVSIWQKSPKTYKLLGIPVAFCWMTYNGFVGLEVGVILEATMFVTAIVGYVREGKRRKKK